MDHRRVLLTSPSPSANRLRNPKTETQNFNQIIVLIIKFIYFRFCSRSNSFDFDRSHQFVVRRFNSGIIELLRNILRERNSSTPTRTLPNPHICILVLYRFWCGQKVSFRTSASLFAFLQHARMCLETFSGMYFNYQTGWLCKNCKTKQKVVFLVFDSHAARCWAHVGNQLMMLPMVMMIGHKFILFYLFDFVFRSTRSVQSIKTRIYRQFIFWHVRNNEIELLMNDPDLRYHGTGSSIHISETNKFSSNSFNAPRRCFPVAFKSASNSTLLVYDV